MKQTEQFSVHATNLLRVHAKNMRTYAGECCLKSTECYEIVSMEEQI